MASVNKVIIVGNLGRDPETRAFPSGDQICNIRVATTDRWRDKTSGEMREHTEWHSVVFGGKLAEIASQYLRKGSQVYVEGSLRTRKWQDQNGNDRYSTEVRGDTMQMLGSRQGQGGGNSGGDDGYGGGYAPAQGGGGGYSQGGGGGYDAPRRAAPPQRQQPPMAQPPVAQPMAQPPMAQPPMGQPQAARPASGFDDMDDDIPF